MKSFWTVNRTRWDLYLATYNFILFWLFRGVLNSGTFIWSVVDGQWSSWSVWSTCSRSCGDGWAVRNRTCSNPPAQNGGADCDVSGLGSFQNQSCNIQNCSCMANASFHLLIALIDLYEFWSHAVSYSINDLCRIEATFSCLLFHNSLNMIPWKSDPWSLNATRVS